jgi:hypothetical protein
LFRIKNISVKLVEKVKPTDNEDVLIKIGVRIFQKTVDEKAHLKFVNVSYISVKKVF